MNVYVAFTMIHPPTWRALAGFDTVGVRCTQEGTYLEHFRARWAAREPFVNVEHDMEFSAGQIRELIDCPEPWCAYGYDLRAGQFPWFGVVRFRPEVMEQTFDVWEQLYGWWTAPPQSDAYRLVGEVPVKGPPPGEVVMQEWLPIWKSLDSWFLRYVQRRFNAGTLPRLECHRHWPNVHNARPAHHPKLNEFANL